MRYNLKAASEALLMKALEDAGLLTNTINEDGETVGWHPAQGVTLDIIGVIYRPTNVVDEEGFPIMVAIDGYHANMIADLTPEQEALLPIISAPKTPSRVFAGE